MIHQKNSGLSDARNTGTACASGSYIVYIDSDDWIDESMIEKLYSALIQNNSELSICGITMTDGSKNAELCWFDKDCVLDKEIAYRELIVNQKITSHAWNKLYKKEIIEDIPFPKGKLYEDIRMMHKVFSKCSRVAVVKQHLYFYYRRPDSISAVPQIHNKLEYAAAFGDRYKYVKEYSPEYSGIVLSQIASVYFWALVQCDFDKKDIQSNLDKIERVRQFLRQKDVRAAVRNHCSGKDKIYYWLATVFSYRSNVIYKSIIKKFTKTYKSWK